MAVKNRSLINTSNFAESQLAAISIYRRVVIVLEVSVMKSGAAVGKKIGDPKAFNRSAPANGNLVLSAIQAIPYCDVGQTPRVVPPGNLPEVTKKPVEPAVDIPILDMTDDEYVDFMRRGLVKPTDGLCP